MCVAATPPEGATNIKCRVFDMRAYPSNLAWDSLWFTCGCPGHAPPCSTQDANRDKAWLKELHEDGGLCKTGEEAVRPVARMFFQLNRDACSLAYVGSLWLTWSQRTYPAYPDLPGPGSGPESLSGTYMCQHDTPYVLCPGKFELTRHSMEGLAAEKQSLGDIGR